MRMHEDITEDWCLVKQTIFRPANISMGTSSPFTYKRITGHLDLSMGPLLGKVTEATSNCEMMRVLLVVLGQ